MLNILCDRLIRMRKTDNTMSAVSLPEVYAALMADDIDSFPALRPHQRHALHAFLVQLAVMALYRADKTEPSCDRDEWADLVRGLTRQFPDDEPWSLVVEDICQPAFMQPPARTADRLTEYKNRVATPDELDMLVTSKNHDLKSAVGSQAHTDDWIFSLITLQTMEGFGGAGNYGISRMNGGLGSRPAFSLAPTGGIGAHVKRDIMALLKYRQTLLAEPPITDGGVTLLWAQPWDGTTAEAIPINELDPFYIEVCRRIRLCANESGDIHGIRTVSKAARIAAKAMKGCLGDPWTPIDKNENKALTLPGGGFTYRQIVKCLNPAEWEWPALLRLTPEEERSSTTTTMQLVARAMVRGQGKTEGYYERVVPLKPKTARAFGRSLDALDLHAIAKRRIERVATVQGILRHAIATFAAHGASNGISPEHRGLARLWANRLDEIVDSEFFEHLQSEFEAKESERDDLHKDWLRKFVVAPARNLLHSAENAVPCPAIHRYRARVAAESLFEGRLQGNQGLAFLYTDRGTNDD